MDFVEDDDIPDEAHLDEDDYSGKAVVDSGEEAHTRIFYEFFQEAFDHYNKHLFDGKLPNVIITVTRKKNIGGYFSPSRWANDAGGRVHEIAMNPMLFAKSSFLQVMSIFCHEMVHLYRHVSFDKPPRGGYHDKKWVDKMLEIGLPPVSRDSKTGVGQRVSHRILKNGLFIKVTAEFDKTAIRYADRFEARPSNIDFLDELEALNEDEVVSSGLSDGDAEQVQDNVTSPVDDEAKTQTVKPDWENAPELNDDTKKRLEKMAKSNEERISDIVPAAPQKMKPKSKYKYQCSCGHSVWGKPGLSIHCGDCSGEFVQFG